MISVLQTDFQIRNVSIAIGTVLPTFPTPELVLLNIANTSLLVMMTVALRPAQMPHSVLALIEEFFSVKVGEIAHLSRTPVT